jgi:microsomal epoxide hydrolase
VQIEPFRIEVDDAVLVDLAERLSRVRLPNQIEGAGWEQGTELGYVEQLLTYWRDDYDWRVHEARLNSLPHFVTEVDGQRIHFVHARSPEPGALPIVLSHGWPGSIVEFLDVIGPLSDPVAHGGDAADAFHVIAPSLPGYGFSGPTHESGWTPRRMAGAFARVMAELGYERYGVQGGDWGSLVSINLADLDSSHVCGLHLNFVVVPFPKDADLSALSADEQAALAQLREFRTTGSGYQEIQGTKPQTLGYALEDSPAGLAAWIVEKFRAWSDCDGDIERSYTKDQLLTNVMVYWVTRTATSSTRLYYETRRAGRDTLAQQVEVPTGIASYPGEITHLPRAWIEARYPVTYWNELPRGGHFAAMEVPDLYVDDVRAFFRTVR